MLGGGAGVARLLHCSESFARDLRSGESLLRGDQREVLEWAQLRSAEELAAVELPERPRPQETPSSETPRDLFERSQRIRRELEIRDRRISAKLDRALARVEEIQATHDQTLRLLSRVSGSLARAQESGREQLRRLVSELRPTDSGRLLAVLDPSAAEAGAGGNGGG